MAAVAQAASVVAWDQSAPLVATGPAGVQRLPVLQIECEAFTGSLAALLECARVRRVDLRGVPMLPICQAYLEYLLATGAEDLDTTGAALTVLAYLVERKAWALLPSPEAEAPEEPELLALPTVGDYHEAIEVLQSLASHRQALFFRGESGQIPYELPFESNELKTDALAEAFSRLLQRSRPEAPILSKPRRSIADMMDRVYFALTPEFRPLETVMTDPLTREEAVWWFLSLLELIRLGRALVEVTEEMEARFAKA